LKIKVKAGSIATPRGVLGSIGEVIEVPDALGLSFIKGGLAEKFETPSKKKTITARSPKIVKKS
jgi:hypothetical protein